jgi:hypothetical protein
VRRDLHTRPRHGNHDAGRRHIQRRARNLRAPYSLGSDRSSLSGNGRYVAFESDDGNLVPAGIDRGVFVRDRLSGVTSLVSVGPNGSPFSFATSPSISADGRFLTFNRGTVVSEVYLRDLTTGQTVGPAPNAFSNHISADARYVTFVGTPTFASNLQLARVYDRMLGALADVAPVSRTSARTVPRGATSPLALGPARTSCGCAVRIPADQDRRRTR